MSQDNVELAKRLHAMVLAGDMDGVLALTADDFVATEIGGALDEPSVFHGREAAASHWAALVEVFDDLHWEVNEWLDVGDWVITVGRWKGRGKASGVEVEGRTANAERWRDGKARRDAAWPREQGQSHRSRRAAGVRDVAGDCGGRETDL